MEGTFCNFKLICAKHRYVVSPRFRAHNATEKGRCPICRISLKEISDSCKIPPKKNNAAWHCLLL
jgi:hypothetical protein